MQEKGLALPGAAEYVSLHESQTHTHHHPEATPAMVGQICQCRSARHREGDLAMIRQGLDDVLLPLHSSLAPGGLHLWPDTEPWLFPVADLQALQHELREELAVALDRRARPVEREPKLLRLHYDTPYTDTRHGLPHCHFCSVKGSIRDVVMLLYFHLMASQDTAALARCCECERIYLRQPNQRYCGKPCANKVSQRAWRARQRQEA